MTTPFDTAAETYDLDFTDTDLGRWLRQRVWDRLSELFHAGDFVLEIGCGTGEDAVWLAQQGIRVLATDLSPVMLQQTQAKAESAGVANLVSTMQFDLNNLPTLSQQFDGVFSNFGAVNCTQDWQGLSTYLAQHTKPAAKLAFGVMSSFCLWETAWHGLHFDFKTAFRRFNGKTMATLPDGATFEVYYPSVRTFTYAFQPQFKRTNIQGLGVFLPPSDSFRVVEKRAWLAKPLINIEKLLAHRWPFRHFADHFWIEFERE